jgi:hypothetical protein
MNSILRCCAEEPVGLTYLAIGSCPYPTSEYPLTPKTDQLFPLCFRQRSLNDKEPMRLIHVDPGFSRSEEVLMTYWKDLTRIEWEEGFHWISDTLDVFHLPDSLSQTDHLWFLESLVETILETNGTLVIQDYTGASLDDLRSRLFASCDQKDLFKRRVLLDMTYETDWGCSTDMTVAQPFYDGSGNFLPLHWMTPTQLKQWCGRTPPLDSVLLKRTRTQYLEALNHIHVDYRRKKQGLPLVYGSPLYTPDSTCDEILSGLRSTLLPLADLLQTLRKGPSLVPTLTQLFETARTEDMYKWYEKVAWLVKP